MHTQFYSRHPASLAHALLSFEPDTCLPVLLVSEDRSSGLVGGLARSKRPFFLILPIFVSESVAVHWSIAETKNSFTICSVCGIFGRVTLLILLKAAG